MSFTMADMCRLYAKHGEALSWFDDQGEGPFSANPADYWHMKYYADLDGWLAVRVPESYKEVS